MEDVDGVEDIQEAQDVGKVQDQGVIDELLETEQEQGEEEEQPSPPSYSRQQTREDTTSLASLASQPSLEQEQEVFESVSKEDISRDTVEADLTLEERNVVSDHGVKNSGPEQGVAGGRSLQDEMQEVEGVHDEEVEQKMVQDIRPSGSRREDDYVAQEDVEEYLEMIKQVKLLP